MRNKSDDRFYKINCFQLLGLDISQLERLVGAAAAAAKDAVNQKIKELHRSYLHPDKVTPLMEVVYPKLKKDSAELTTLFNDFNTFISELNVEDLRSYFNRVQNSSGTMARDTIAVRKQLDDVHRIKDSLSDHGKLLTAALASKADLSRSVRLLLEVGGVTALAKLDPDQLTKFNKSLCTVILHQGALISAIQGVVDECGLPAENIKLKQEVAAQSDTIDKQQQEIKELKVMLSQQKSTTPPSAAAPRSQPTTNSAQSRGYAGSAPQPQAPTGSARRPPASASSAQSRGYPRSGGVPYDPRNDLFSRGWQSCQQPSCPAGFMKYLPTDDYYVDAVFYTITHAQAFSKTLADSSFESIGLFELSNPGSTRYIVRIQFLVHATMRKGTIHDYAGALKASLSSAYGLPDDSKSSDNAFKI